MLRCVNEMPRFDGCGCSHAGVLCYEELRCEIEMMPL